MPQTQENRGLAPQGIASYLSPAGLGFCCAAAMVAIYGSREARKGAELAPGRVIDVKQLSDLGKVVLPALVALRGRVNSYAPTKCELSSRSAVIHEVVEEEVWRKQRAEGRTVYEPFETRKVFEECEWFVEDGSPYRVKVENALQAERLRTAMETKTEFMPEDMSQKTLGKVLMEKAWAMTKHGMRKTERYLPVGSVVTCVGELSHNHICGPPPNSTASSAPSSSLPLPSLPQPSTTSTSTPSASAGVPSSSATGGSAGAGGASSGSAGGLFGSGLSVGFGGQPSGSGSSSGNASTASNSSGGGGSSGAVAAGGPALPNVLGLLGRGNNQSVHPDIPYVLRKPTSGPSYITPLTVEQLRAALSGTARNCRWIALALGAVGVALLVRKAWARFSQVMHERRVRARVAQAERQRKEQAKARKAAALAAGGAGSSSEAGRRLGSSGAGDEDLEGGGDGDREPGTCVICLEDKADVVFTSCGHLCCCVGCGLHLDKCPLCRIKGRAIKVFHP